MTLNEELEIIEEGRRSLQGTSNLFSGVALGALTLIGSAYVFNTIPSVKIIEQEYYPKSITIWEYNSLPFGNSSLCKLSEEGQECFAGGRADLEKMILDRRCDNYFLNNMGECATKNDLFMKTSPPREEEI